MDDYMGYNEADTFPAEDPQSHYEKQLLERYQQYKDYHIDVQMFGQIMATFTLADIVCLTKLIKYKD